jgi:hypothetical protein
MKAAFYPVGQIGRASSRYRVYNVIDASDSFIKGSEDNWVGLDALVFQRTTHYMELARRVRKKGKLIVFDWTDVWFYKNEWEHLWEPAAEMAELAHCLTTSNQDDAEMLRETFKKHVYVIPGAQPPSKYKRKHGNYRPPTVGWLGRENRMGEALGAIWAVLSKLPMMGTRYRLLLINDTGDTHGLTLPYTEIAGMKWDRHKVYRQLANNCDIGICPQVLQSDGKFHKDENKSWTFQLCGIPCVSFARTKDWYDDLHKLIAEPDYRKWQGKRGTDRAREVHPKRIAGYWHKILSREAEAL